MIEVQKRENTILRKLYATPTRYYHTARHAMYVANAVNVFCKSNGIEPESVLKAAYWHDAVYVFGESNNEELSALALLDFDATQTEAADLIRLTTIDEHLSDRINFESNPKASILFGCRLGQSIVPVSRFHRTPKTYRIGSWCRLQYRQGACGFSTEVPRQRTYLPVSQSRAAREASAYEYRTIDQGI